MFLLPLPLTVLLNSLCFLSVVPRVSLCNSVYSVVETVYSVGENALHPRAPSPPGQRGAESRPDAWALSPTLMVLQSIVFHTATGVIPLATPATRHW